MINEYSIDDESGLPSFESGVKLGTIVSDL